MPTVHLLIKGKVQGVYYRASAKEQADLLGITGWVRNTRQGDVEITATSDKTTLDKFIAWCQQGPDRAIVTHLETKFLPETGFKGFTVIRD